MIPPTKGNYMNNIEIIQNCQVCFENSLKRGFIVRHTFTLCEKCNQAMNGSKAGTDVSEWDKPWYGKDWVEPKASK